MLAHEAGGSGGPEGLADAGDRACQKLSSRLELLVGPQGARAVVEYALRGCRAEFDFLEGVEAGYGEGGCLKGLRENLQGREAGEANLGLVALLADTLGTLGGLIGREMVFNLLKSCWPEMPDCDECDFQEWEVGP